MKNCTGLLIPDRSNHLGIGPGLASLILTNFIFHLQYQTKHEFFGYPKQRFSLLTQFFVWSSVTAGLSIVQAAFQLKSASSFRQPEFTAEYGLHIAIGVTSILNFISATAALAYGLVYLILFPVHVLQRKVSSLEEVSSSVDENGAVPPVVPSAPPSMSYVSIRGIPDNTVL